MEKNLTSIDIERILTEYEEALFVRTEELEGMEFPDMDFGTDTQLMERIVAGALRRKVSVLKNKDYYAAKLMQLYKLSTLLSDDEYSLDEAVRESCVQYLLNELRDDLLDVLQLIDTLPDLRVRHNPS
ncbi:MAG: hypothetical protein HFE75_01305 [Firmicutes bacterium]|jgi:hypothetical protein|nr:hypothetical protein [Bacillota bacterium]NBI63734.1 hypothetical protein [Clostridiales bacterium]